jgi:hypothetical protein
VVPVRCGGASRIRDNHRAPAVTRLRMTNPDLDFWIDVRLRDFDGRWLAVADLADTPDIGTGDTAEAALLGALASLGGTWSEDLTAGVFG